MPKITWRKQTPEERFQTVWTGCNRAIRTRMAENDLKTIKEAAAACGIPYSTMRERMSGKSPWTHRELVAVVSGLDMPAEMAVRLLTGG